MSRVHSIELFTGGGGLAIGLEQAGFYHDLLIERNKDANQTIKYNREKMPETYGHWELCEADVHGINFDIFQNQVTMIAGGPPCQPFSLGGKHKGKNDSRDLFPEAVRTVREVKPKAFIFENVRGLLRPAFSSYFEYVLLQLQYPNHIKKDSETFNEHLNRLEKIHTSKSKIDLKYNVLFRCLNAADYGIPQKRDRVFIIGFRSDLDINYSFPEPTHGQDELLWDKWVTNEYWKRHGIKRKDIPQPTTKEIARVERLRKMDFIPKLKPWRTVRDAIHDLPDPVKSSNTKDYPLNHEFKGGAKAYPGHTGSYLDEPSKTLKAGGHGVPGGENMIHYYDDTYRYFTVRESARIQTFPDDYAFLGSWGEAMRQIGNAVPVKLAKVVGDSVYSKIMGIK